MFEPAYASFFCFRINLLLGFFGFGWLYYFVFKVLRRRRDLNPRAAINDLLPFQGSPFGQLGYFSLVETFPCFLYYECQREGRAFESPLAMGAPRAIRNSSALQTPYCIYGEDGIRTHVPVKANGFQDRLVMTTSIPLQVC